MTPSGRVIRVDMSSVPPHEAMPFLNGVKAAIAQLWTAELNEPVVVDKPQKTTFKFGEFKRKLD